MAKRPAPVCIVGKYEVYPLSVCAENEIADLFARICRRGNPLLQDKPHEDLLILGAAMYRKSSPYLGSVACLLDGKPVALRFGWDCADGGVWKGTSGPPASLRAHGLVGGECWGTWPKPFALPESDRKGEMWFGAFGGVSLPHPGALMGVMAMITFPWMAAAGWRYYFGYVVHPGLIAQQGRMEANIPLDEVDPGVFARWVITYSKIEAADSEVKAELESLKPGFTNCTIMKMRMVVSSFSANFPFVKESKAVADRLGTWGSEAYYTQLPLAIPLPDKGHLEEQATSKL